MLIAPCSATTLSKLATGNADNPVSCVALAIPQNKPLVVAPAMDFTMFEHPATQNNIELIKSRGAIIIEPAEGELASGLKGKGRLPDNEILMQEIISVLKIKNYQPLKNKNVLITAGATQEKIDDVRYISNYSSGKMGYALAKVATELGANVTLITGSSNLQAPSVHLLESVLSAEEMFNAVKKYYKQQDIIIMSAAVSDYAPTITHKGKIKKDNDEYIIKLKKTQDILKFLGENINHNKTKLIGFALESDNQIENATKKLNEKKCDLIILNSVYGDDSGFGGDNNTITILSKDNKIKKFKAMNKYDCAKKIFEYL
jgi:phosphopantothenoylcysteine decarboxylase/phosphopantothenate--cysteine ligase